MYFLICDGGAKPSGCYGSFVILEGRTLEDKGAVVLRREAFDLPDATTNNEAEYYALLIGLAGLKEIIPRDGRRRWIKVLMDSELVVKQVSGEHRVLAKNLIDLNLRALRLLASFSRPQRISLVWVDRDVVKGFLGH